MYFAITSMLLPLTIYHAFQSFLRDVLTHGGNVTIVQYRTCVDMMSINDPIRLVRCVSSHTSSTTEITERVERILRLFPPDEQIMRNLSMFQQKVRGEGGEREFCVVTVFAIATLCIQNGIHRPSPPRRTNSFPTVHRSIADRRKTRAFTM